MRHFLRSFIKIISAEETLTRNGAYDNNVNVRNVSTTAIIITWERDQKQHIKDAGIRTQINEKIICGRTKFEDIRGNIQRSF